MLQRPQLQRAAVVVRRPVPQLGRCMHPPARPPACAPHPPGHLAPLSSLVFGFEWAGMYTPTPSIGVWFLE